MNWPQTLSDLFGAGTQPGQAGSVNGDTVLLEHFESVRDMMSDQTYFVDRFPVLISDPERFGQVEVFYDGAFQRRIIPRLVYLSEEDRFLRVMDTLWAGSAVLVESSLAFEDGNFGAHLPNDMLRRRLHAFRTSLGKAEGVLVPLSSHLDLRILMYLGLRERVHSVLVFPQWRVVVWLGQGLVLPVVVTDTDAKDMVSQICLANGLYLRKA